MRVRQERERPCLRVCAGERKRERGLSARKKSVSEGLFVFACVCASERERMKECVCVKLIE